MTTADPAARGRRWLGRVVAAAAGAAVALSVVPAPAAAEETIRFDGPVGAPDISVIGDSTLAGVRWYADYGALRNFGFVLDAESCRRTVDASCISREGFRSQNVITTMRTLEGELGELLVVMTGYNDPPGSIDEAIDAVVAEARRQDVGHVVWLTLRTSPDVDYSDPQEQSSTDTFRAYNERLLEAAAESDGYLQVADWATWSYGADGWFEYDGVHLARRGVDPLTSFIADAASRVLAGDDITPGVAPWTVLVPGAEGDAVAEVQGALLRAGVEVPGGADGVYGYDTMAAVAEYQRGRDDLQETGAVDAATARALGVLSAADDGDTDVLEGAPGVANASANDVSGIGTDSSGADADVGSSDPAGSATAIAVDAGDTLTDATGSGGPSWPLIALGVLGALVLAVVTRRRYVVARRRARRLARVHPSTSPHRSVADLRRSGRLPARPSVDGFDGVDLDAADDHESVAGSAETPVSAGRGPRHR